MGVRSKGPYGTTAAHRSLKTRQGGPWEDTVFHHKVFDFVSILFVPHKNVTEIVQESRAGMEHALPQIDWLRFWLDDNVALAIWSGHAGANVDMCAETNVGKNVGIDNC